MELEDPEFFKDELKTWKTTSNLLYNSLSSSSPRQLTSHEPSQLNLHSIPVMIFETILDLQALPSNSILVLEDSQGQGIRLNHLSSITNQSKSNQEPSFRNIVLERWTVSLSTPIPPLPGPELPTVYRYCIVHFRALYSYSRTLPAWQLFKRLKKPGSKEHDLLKIGCRLSSTSVIDEAERLQRAIDENSIMDEIGIDQPLSDLNLQTHLKHFEFPSVQTPYGALHSQVTYRNQVEFYISDRETALSSKFMAEDLNPDPQTDLIMRLHRLRSGYSVPNPIKTHQSSRAYDKVSTHNDNQDPISPKPSYGSLSSRHPLHPRSSSNDVNDLDQPGSAASSLTAAIRAAAESSTFSTPIPQHPPPTQLSQLHGNSSALTAKLVAKRQSLPPVLSNALPSPSSMNRGYLAGLAGRPQSTSIGMTGHSPRQTASVLSSSPLSGPSSSIRMSSNRPLIPSSMAISSSPLSPALHSGSQLSLGTSVTGTGGIGPRPMPTQPLSRRYSSSRHSRSYGQGSSGGTLDSSLSRRALLNSENSTHSSSGSRHKERLAGPMTVDEVGEINSFLELLDSKPNLKRSSNDQPNSTTILSKSQAEVTMNRLAGSVYGTRTDQSNPNPTATNPSMNHRKRLSLNNSLSNKPNSVLQGLLEEDEQQQQQHNTQLDRLYSPSHVNHRSSPLSVSPGSFMNRFTSARSGVMNDPLVDHHHHHHHRHHYPMIDDDEDDGEVVGKLELSYPTTREDDQ
ncbi:autophagy-related protein 13-domain-containing protein [Melampsora americana]|nr:autophagy-related protein 13-domain-containing protein [Melampsora americana]